MTIDPKKIIKLSQLAKNGVVAVAKYLFEVEDRVDSVQSDVLDMGKKLVDVEKELKERISSDTSLIEKMAKNLLKDIKGDKGDLPVAGVDYPIPENGKDYVLTDSDKQDIAKKITVPVVEKIIERTEVIKEQPIVTNEIKEIIKEVTPIDTGEQIVDKINVLPIDPESQIEKEHIKGLEDWMKLMEERISNIPRGRGGGGRSGNSVQYYDISSELNGSTKVFTIPSNRRVLLITGTSLPTTFRPLIDYTVDGRTLTFTSQIDEATTLASGQTITVLYVGMFNTI